MILNQILDKRIMVLDGAMGTMIQKYKLTEKEFRGKIFSEHSRELKGFNDVLSITQPDVIYEIHKQYLEADADIIETNTFNSTSISMSDYGLEKFAYQINYNSARLAKKAVKDFIKNKSDVLKFVAGSIGPTNKTASLSPKVEDPAFRSVTFDDLVNSYTEQVEGLLDGGVDILLVETIFDTLNAKAAFFAIENVFEKRKISVPIMISVTISDSSGRTLSGQTLEAFVISVSHVNSLSIGLNCSTGAKDMLPALKRLSKITDKYVSAYPNAGFPNQFGEYEETPEIMAEQIREFLELGLINIVGGCCGTTPEHIKYFSELVRNYEPRKITELPRLTRISGLEPLVFTSDLNFVNIGERTNVAGSKKFARLIKENKFEDALSVAREQVEGGAQIIDICMDDAMINGEEAMRKFLNMIASEPEISKLPIMIDSSKWSIIETGLKCTQGKSIVNSISLKEGEEVFKKHARLVKKYGAATIVMAFDEIGQADTFERKIEICKRAYKILTEEVSFPPEDIIFDPNILAIATGIEEHNNYALNYIKATRWIKENLPYCKVSGGVSNLSFAFRGNDKVREAIHSAFLYHAINAGMDMGIVNPSQLEVYENIPKDLLNLVEDVILNRRKDAVESLLAYTDSIKAEQTKIEKKESDWRHNTIEERLKYSLLKGIDEYLEEDITAALEHYEKALNIIEGPLMDGMNYVGELFGEGKMFLPQVVKSARVMKKAVSFLMPYIEKENVSGKSNKAGKVLLATVKGDVHDIGKNIVGVVLGCNNYEIIDLGVMTPTEKIIKIATREKVDIIGLSGLITPSLEEMINVAQEMERNNLKIPLLIGGATTSELHTAVKIAPNCNFPVIHVKDASKSVNVVASLLSLDNREEYILKKKSEYEKIRNNYLVNVSKRNYISISKARENKFSTDWDEVKINIPNFLGLKVFIDLDLREVAKYIDWTFFFYAWKISGRYPDIFDDPKKGKEAKKLYDDAIELLNSIINNRLLTSRAIIGIFPANSIGDDIEIYSYENSNEVVTTFHFLRNQEEKKDNSKNLCLSDFIAPKEIGKKDYIGMFCISSGFGIDNLVKYFTNINDDYNSIMSKILADRLAEATLEMIHLKVRKQFWGYSKNEELEVSDLLKSKYQGIRPAFGYPSMPDHSEKKILFDLLNVEKLIGVKLTENFAMYPASSISGFFISHPKSSYFNVEKISEDQLIDYARRKDISKYEAEKWLSQNLNYK
ncbi:MAG TPA: methionine synthase [Ignavibacteria bacterium]